MPARVPEKTGKGKKLPPDPAGGEDAAQLIDGKIATLGGWRGDMLARMRALIHEAVPDVTEEIKWRGVPVWSRDGILCTGETYKDKVKLTFARGASLDDPAGLFNASLEGNMRRAIDLHEGGEIDGAAFKALVQAAAAFNTGKKAASPRRPKKTG